MIGAKGVPGLSMDLHLDCSASGVGGLLLTAFLEKSLRTVG